MGVVNNDMGLDEFMDSSKQSNSSQKNVIQDESKIQNIISESDAIVLDYEARRGGYSCKCKCNQCGDTYRKGISRINRGDGKYCSPKCSQKSRKGVAQKNINIESTELYYIAGLVYGDGHLTHVERTGNYDVNFTNTSLTLIDSFKSSIEEIGGTVSITTHVRDDDNHSDCYTSKVSSLSLYNKIKDDFSSPSDVSNSCNSKTHKLKFIQGFYEAEGSVQKYRLRISQKDKEILDLLCEFIESEIGVTPVVREYGDDFYNLVIDGSLETKVFLNKINPVIKIGAKKDG